MTRVRTLCAVFAVALLGVACGGLSQPAVPTLPPDVSQSGPADQSVEPAALALKPPTPVQTVPTPLPPPWPTFTPGPRPQSKYRLLYARTGRFWTANADGSDLQPLKFKNRSPQLLTPFKDPGRGWLSPDGRWLVYLAGDAAELWVADLTTGENVRLAERMLLETPSKDVRDPAERALVGQEMAWTSDGSRIALLGVPDTYDLFVVDLATGAVTRITDSELREGDFVWSPDDRYLAFTAFDPAFGGSSIHVWDSETGRRVDFSMAPVAEAANVNPTLPFGFDRGLTFLDDSRFIFYPISRQGSVGIWLADAANGNVEPVTTDSLADVAWSPEAKAWVYARRDEPGMLWLLRPGDKEPRLLTDDEAYAPVWSPDGRSILYSRGGPDAAGWDLKVIDLETGEAQVLATNVSLVQRAPPEPGPGGKRYWTPDARLVIYSTVGRDYGRAERFGGQGVEAGPDLENWWMTTLDRSQPWQATDLEKVFYLQEPSLSPDGQVWAFVGFSYVDLTQHLWTIPRTGGHPVKVDSGVRWFRWLP